MWKPDRGSRQPLYLQIADHLERRIVYGEYPPGSFLPSERQLASQLGVNRSTVVQAYEELRAKDIVDRTVGSGTTVSQEPWGLSPRRSPNWRPYVEGGVFAPNLPLIRRVRQVLRERSPLIDLASGELSPDLFPNAAVQRLLKETPFAAQLGYDDPQGYLPLRRTLVRLLEQEMGIRTTESSILITSGSQQSLYLITQCLLSPGDAVAVEDPSYAYSLSMLQSAGLRPFLLPVDDDGIRPEDVVRLHKEHRLRMLFLNPHFQNPTGTLLSAQRRTQLLAVAAELGLPIVEDDPFSLTAFSGRPPQPLKAVDAHGSVLYVGSLSKIAASGFRIGWMIAPQSVVERIADARQQMDFGLSVLPQWLAHAFLESGLFGEHLHTLRRTLAAKQARLLDALETRLPGRVAVRPAAGGLTLWCDVGADVDMPRLLEEAIRQGVVFMPGSVFGTRPGFVRLSFARPAEAELARGAQLFAAALRGVSP